MSDSSKLKVSLVALPESFLSCLVGLYDTFEMASTSIAPGRIPFDVEIVAQSDRVESLTSRFPIVPHRTIDRVQRTDLVVVPAAVVDTVPWQIGRHPDALEWIRRMYRNGAVVSSACSGALLLAETGLLDSQVATTHWNEADRFRTHFPDVRLDLTRELIVSGEDRRIVTAGAAAAWHDLALYLISRYSGPEAAQAVAKYFMLQWHTDGQTPYLSFDTDISHGDAAILRAQAWIDEHIREPNLLADLPATAGLAPRTFTRRFRQATGFSPSSYLQRIRIEEAKSLLERTKMPIEQICWTIGYDDPSSFRRLFKRITAVTPGYYRRMFTHHQPSSGDPSR
ncbi:MAG TPA: helix-turn-helix domain-containing protein [Acidimicrobiales bacterium]